MSALDALAEPPPPSPSTTDDSLIVASTDLEKLRVAGDTKILPSDRDREAIARGQQTAIVGVFKVCVDDSGAVASTRLLRSTNYRDYDAKLEREIKAWRYRPFVVDGKPTPVCTAVTFVYKPASP